MKRISILNISLLSPNLNQRSINIQKIWIPARFDLIPFVAKRKNDNDGFTSRKENARDRLRLKWRGNRRCCLRSSTKLAPSEQVSSLSRCQSPDMNSGRRFQRFFIKLWHVSQGEEVATEEEWWLEETDEARDTLRGKQSRELYKQQWKFQRFSFLSLSLSLSRIAR